MQTPIRLDQYADRRLAYVSVLPIVGVDLSAATLRAQVRLYPDAPALISAMAVTVPYAGNDAVSDHISLGHITAEIYAHVNPATGENYAPTDNIDVSVVHLSLSSSAMTTDMPAASEAGDVVELAWDLLVDPDGAGADHEDKWIYGTFFVRGTVTQ